MCFNSISSLSAFTFGTLCSMILFYKSHYFYALFSFSIVIMQLSEYFAHISLVTKNKHLNNLASKSIYLILFLQPIIYTVCLIILPPDQIQFLYPNSINQVYIPLLLIYITLIAYYYNYLNRKDLFYTTYFFDNCKHICRLNWNFLNTKPLLIGLFVIIYFIFFLLFSYKDSNRQITFLNHFNSIVLLLSLIYIILIGRNKPIKKIFTTFGSLWCFLCVFYGLILLITLP